jgi:hypothetical protein
MMSDDMQPILQLHNMTDEPMQMRFLRINKHHWNGEGDLRGLILTDDTEIVIRKETDRICGVYRRRRT